MSKNYYLAPRCIYSEYTEKFGYPIYLRFSYKGTESMLAISQYIRKREYWNDKIKKVVAGPYMRQKNDFIANAIDEADARIKQAILDGEGPSVRAFKGKSLESFEDYINSIEKKSNNGKGLIKAIKGFCNKVPDIEYVTVKWLRNLEDYMWGGADLERNSVAGYMGVLRKVLNQAVIEKYIVQSPIGITGYRVPSRGKQALPEFLVETERNAMLKELLSGKKFTGDKYMVLAYFMLGCYFGLRYSDWAQFRYDEHIRSGHLIIEAKKNRERIVQKIHPKSDREKILQVLKRIGPLTVSYEMCLKYLEEFKEDFKITIELTTHIGKHTFGYGCAAAEIPKDVAAKLMGNSMETIDVYYHLTGEHVKKQSKGLAKI